MKLACQLGLFTDGYDGDVSNTVDAADASYASNIGEALLVAHRSDPEFDCEQSAF